MNIANDDGVRLPASLLLPLLWFLSTKRIGWLQRASKRWHERVELEKTEMEAVLVALAVLVEDGEVCLTAEERTQLLGLTNELDTWRDDEQRRVARLQGLAGELKAMKAEVVPGRNLTPMWRRVGEAMTFAATTLNERSRVATSTTSALRVLMGAALDRKRAAARVSSAWQVFSALLPARIAKEDLGDLLEDLSKREARGASKLELYARGLSGALWMAVAAAKDIAAVIGTALGK